MDVTEFGIVIVVNLVHSSKTPSSIEVIELGKVIVFKLVHPEKAACFILLIVFGNIKEVIFVLEIKALSSMLVTLQILPLGKVTVDGIITSPT